MSNATANAINAQLYRNIKSGKEYEHLMPYSDCSSVKLAVGDTKVAINNMASWSKKYQHHTKKLAQVFKNTQLKKTCVNIHSFLYNHFQYKIDGEKQNLRSPACSWYQRKTGIDCKSYSIIASTILSNLGISHFFRRVKTAPNQGYSHVYVIVPNNQKQPKKLSDGYHIIDGTLPYTNEPIFHKKDDVYMEAKLPIYGLAGSLNNPVSGALMQGAATMINLAVQGLLNELLGCDDADYEYAIVEMRINRDLKQPLEKKVADLSDAINWNNRTRIQFLFNDLFKELDLGIAHLRNETAFSQRDKCIAEILLVALKYIEKIKEIVDTFYNNFLQSFTLYKVDEFTKTATTTDRTLYFVVGQSDNPISAEYRYIVLRKKESKYGIEPILPYGEAGDTFEKTATKWLLENTRFLNNNYSDDRAIAYKSEIQPYIDQISELRKSAHLGGNALYLFEQPIQRKMYKVWLKYDDKYTDFLKKETESLRTANELAMRDYKERFTKEIEKDKEVKKRKAFKKNIGIGALAFAGFLVVKNK
ncbi:transglutaminase-like domain-containing protein [Tenacibaculum soleae]|uniref:transglutaminase-like domain-containing protein n=1 Tax=Tenacibaculum soleae TaxID=447689 RepID=UPI0023005A2B|nr:transglutaminase-like domain-containing protein [Tenacibaculum soleae]